MSLAISVGILVAGAVYLVLQRGMVRIVLGFVLLGHAANLILISAGVTATRDLPFIGAVAPDESADPLPQAFVLTSIVISFSIAIYMFTLAATGTDDDDTEDDE